MLQMDKISKFLFAPFKQKKSLLFFVLNISVFAVLLTFVVLKIFVFTEEIIPDSHGIIFLPMEFFDINEVLSQPYEEVASVSTKYSILYKEGDHRKMYVFSIPIREIENDQYFLFDNGIYENDSGTYKTQNREFNIEFKRDSASLSYTGQTFAVLFDGSAMIKEEDYINTYGETREAVKYTGAVEGFDLRCIPTYNGLLMEFDLPRKPEKNEITIEIDINKLGHENDPAGYAKIINDDENNVGVIYQGIAVDNDGKFYTNNAVKITEKSKKHYLTVDLSKLPADVSYPAKLAVHFDFYNEKMFYDTSVYEAAPKVNTMLNNVSVFDSENKGNDGHTYLKYNIRSFTPKNPAMIDLLAFNFYVMSVADSIDIEVFRVPKEWCSSLMNWRDKAKHREKLGEFTLSETGWHRIDLTEYAKKLIERDYDKIRDNSIVLKVKPGSKSHAVLASVDNSYAPPYFEVHYRVR